MNKFACSALLLLLSAQGMAAFNLDNRKPNAYVMENDKPWVEQEQALVPYPLQPQWLQLEMPVTIRPQIFVNTADLQLGPDQVIRFSLRQASKSGVENISREGLHCEQRNYRSYAFGDPVNKRWISSQNSQWRKLDVSDLLRRELVTILCPQGWTPATAAEVITNLQRAGKAQ